MNYQHEEKLKRFGMYVTDQRPLQTEQDWAASSAFICIRDTMLMRLCILCQPALFQSLSILYYKAFEHRLPWQNFVLLQSGIAIHLSFLPARLQGACVVLQKL